MQIGAAMFFTDYAMDAGAFPWALEERGFDSVWAPEHSHIPASRLTPFPQGGEMPRKYAECMDPFVSLTLAAAMTKTIKLGTGVCLVVQRDPIQTAKLVASLDQVSHGRFLFGIGGGWNAEEMADHGTTDFKGRWKLVRERVEAMKAIWTQDTPEYHGALVDFGPMHAWPKPVQKPPPAGDRRWRFSVWGPPSDRLWRRLGAARFPPGIRRCWTVPAGVLQDGEVGGTRPRVFAGDFVRRPRGHRPPALLSRCGSGSGSGQPEFGRGRRCFAASGSVDRID